MYQFYNPYQQWQPQTPTIPQYQQQYQPQPQNIQPTSVSASNLNGKIVGSVDEARGMDVPVGSIGYYPNGNGTEIYVKSWQSDGSTKIDVYERKVVETEINPNSNDTTLDDIFNSIQSLSKKIDTLTPKPTTTYPINKSKKKVGEEDE